VACFLVQYQRLSGELLKVLKAGHLRGVFYGTMSTFVRRALEGSEGGEYK
jgi:hypothetical protein